MWLHLPLPEFGVSKSFGDRQMAQADVGHKEESSRDAAGQHVDRRHVSAGQQHEHRPDISYKT